MRILVVEDDVSLRRGISYRLEKEGYPVDTSENAAIAKALLAREIYDVILLDISLPDGDGFALCEQIRRSSGTHIIFLTALDEEHNIVHGYDIGADDYITKPFSMMVLLSKLHLIQKKLSTDEIRFISGELIWDAAAMTLEKNGRPLTLTKNELRLFTKLIGNAGQIMTKKVLLQSLWDSDGYFTDENIVAVNIRRLREKIEDNPSRPSYIANIRGLGYQWMKGVSRL